MTAPWRAVAGGIELFVRLTPRAAGDRIDGFREASDGSVALAARVRAVPEKGKANVALTRLVADALDIPASAVTLAAGGTSRIKTLRIDGDAAELEKALLRALGDASARP